MMKQKRPPFGFCYPGYRYCGPGCTGPGAPTNPVDACCQMHDRCYALYGYKSQYCDDLFHYCLQPYMNPNDRMGRNAILFSRAINLKSRLF